MPAGELPRSRSLLPREHGAYGQLGAPVAAALASGRPGLAALALTVAAVALFVGHEPALVLAGQRGPRAQREVGDRARRRLGSLGLIAAAAGGLGVALGGAAVALAAGAALGLGLVTAGLVWRGLGKTLVGELSAAAALAAAGVPIAIAGGVDAAGAGRAWLAWTLGFAAVTAAVRDVIARGKRRRSAGPPLVLATAVVTAAGLMAGLSRDLIACAPLVTIAVGLALAPAAPRRLRQIGWALATASLATGTWLVIVARWE